MIIVPSIPAAYVRMDSQSSTSSRLLSMPLEVLLHISSNLTTPDYGVLRCVCKHLEASFFNSFAKEFFSKRQFMFTEFSLQALVDISRSRLAPSLKYLIISVERPTTTMLTESDVRVRNTGQYERFNRFKEEFMSHQFLKSTGRDFELLAEALQNLSGLKTVGVRDYSSLGRSRDGAEARWNSYGAPTLYQETGLRPRYNGIPEQSLYPCHVFQTILRALGKSPNVNAERFEVILRNETLSDQAFYIPRHLEPTLTPVLANLKALYLDLDDRLPPTRFARGDSVQCCYSVALMEFLSKLPALEHLRLNFQQYGSAHASELLQWLSTRPNGPEDRSGPALPDQQTLQAADIPKLPPPVEFTRLTQIDLGFAIVKVHILVELYKRYRSTLRSISLHKVTLEPVTSEPTNRIQKVNLWAQLFNKMSKSGLDLSSISLRSVRQTYSHFGAWPVTFKGATAPDWKNWAGSDLDCALREFRDSVVVNWPEDSDYTDHSVVSEESDEEEAEMDEDES
ncbi:hypothetical protein DL769_003001 [Monosporascus sp. CRB-8-3]|nr:hypothetical protein DL769_003001 [Monosporascus sp. CRB-8-3]